MNFLYCVAFGNVSSLEEQTRDRRIDEMHASFGQNADEIVKTLGAPLNATEEWEGTEERSTLYRRSTFVYDGLCFTELYMPAQEVGGAAEYGRNEKRWIASMVCSSDRYPLRYVRVGDSIEKVFEIFGEPRGDLRDTSEMTYFSSSFYGQKSVTFLPGKDARVDSIHLLNDDDPRGPRDIADTRYIEEIMHSFGSTMQEVTGCLGEPDKKSVRIHLNQFDNPFAIFTETLQYDGLEIVFVKVPPYGGHGEKIWIESFICSSDKYPILNVQVGDPLGKAMQELGEPSERTLTNVIFSPHQWSGDLVLVLSVDQRKRITEIKGVYFSD